MGRWICCLCSRVADSLMLLLVLALSCNYSTAATASPPAPHVKPSYSFGRTFLGLDKCNACIGTSICKKFFKEEIRSETQHRRPPPASWGARAGNPGRGRRPAGTERSNAVLRSCGEMKFAASAAVPHNTGCHFGNLSCDQAFLDGAGFLSWEAFAVEIPPLVRTHQQLCRRGRGAQRCPCPRHGPSTLRSRRLENKPLCRVFPSRQGLSSPMLRCPSQRLLDRIVRRYAEVPDAGSIYMDHLTERDKLRLLYTLSVNSHPILLQVRTASPGLGTPPRNPLPVNLGVCGRLVYSASTRPLRDFYGAAPEVAADLALQLLAVLRSMGTNDLNYFFYFTHVDAGTFGVFSNGHLFIRDASALGIIDKEEGSQLIDGQQKYKDIFSCLTVDCRSAFVSCNSIREQHSLVMVCQQLLPKLLKGKFLQPVQEKIDSFLQHCANGLADDQGVNEAVAKLAELLKPLRSCDSRFAYRYPDCKYSDKY
nr:PREDICTED: deleted in autism-related protein 1 [Opisthocomus hoazin]